jgi:hypothetical protein
MRQKSPGRAVAAEPPSLDPGRPIVVPELRDYLQINAEMRRRLDRGHRLVRLEGVAGQRLLVSAIAGSWQATVEIDGNAGPELAAELNAPGLTIVCRGSAADGVGRGMAAGKLLVMGGCGTAVGYSQQGGLIVGVGAVGPRAGLCQRGGDLVLLDRLGMLAGERQAGGRIFFKLGLAGPHVGHTARGGRRVPIPAADALSETLDPDDALLLEEAKALAARFGP